MSGVEFDEQGSQFKSYGVSNQSHSGGMSAWLVKRGIIKEESQAKSIFLGIIFLNFILMGVVIYYFVL